MYNSKIINNTVDNSNDINDKNKKNINKNINTNAYGNNKIIKLIIENNNITKDNSNKILLKKKRCKMNNREIQNGIHNYNHGHNTLRVFSF